MWTFKVDTQLPRLAWVASVTNNQELSVEVIHGENVEVGENFFIEGAWESEYKNMNFENAIFLMGSGGKQLNNKIIFSTPSHTHERLYSIERIDQFLISNSLPLLLNESNNELKNDYLHYEKDFDSILKGISNYKETIPLSNENLRVHYYRNILLSKNLKITILEKNTIEAFKDYNDYYNRILNIFKGIVNNSRDDRRKLQYGLVTTISQGYDAAACAALARKVGCNTALTFDAPKKYAEDDGTEIAKKLGYLNIVKKDANEYLKNKKFKETEFLASAELGNGIVFSAFEDEFKNNLVVIGERGDQIWDKNKKTPNNNLIFKEANVNSSLGEHRLNTSYIFLPISLFGITEWVSVHKLSNSNEMDKYSIGGNYDRPIPRRIVEESGVPREMFGQAKKGAGFNYKYDNKSRIKKRMSEKSFNDFINYYNKNKGNRILVLGKNIKFIWNLRNIYLSHFLKKLGISYKRKSVVKDLYNPGASSFLFKWSINKLQNKYKENRY